MNVSFFSLVMVNKRREGLARKHLPKDMPPELMGHLFKMFEQHFGVTLRKLWDPETGKEYVDLAQVCEVLELDLDKARAQILADPEYPSDALAIVEPEPVPPMVPADLQAHQIGICTMVSRGVDPCSDPYT